MNRKSPYILVSTCLLGLPVQYNEEYEDIPELLKLVKDGKALFICPEQSGGLPTPRVPSEIEPSATAKLVLSGKNRIMNKNGEDVSKQFIKGANIALSICKQYNIKTAILKAKSPSCGSLKTYDGTFTGTLIKGRGITAELLSQNGITVYNEKNYPKDI